MVRRRSIPNLRWIIAALIFVNTLANYIDRQTLSVLAPTLAKAFDLSQIQYANIVEAFLLSYTIMVVPAGLAFNRWGVRAVFAGATLWWSAAEVLPIFATSAWQLGAMRLLLGCGEAFTFVGAAAVAAEWYPAAERALLAGLANAAAVFGAVVAPPVVVWILLNWGWKSAFLITAAIGFVWIPLWLLTYHKPEDHPRISIPEAALLKASTKDQAQDASQNPSWWKLLSSRETWGLLIARIFSDPVWWFYLFWLPKYLTESRGFSMKQVGMAAWIPYLASDIGSIAGGWYSGRLIARGWRTLPARRGTMLVSAAVMPLGILIAYTKSAAVALALMAAALFFHMSWKTNLMTMTVDIFPRPVVASVAGIIGAGGGAGAALFTNLVGWLLAHYSYTPIFWVMGFLHPIAFLFVYWTIRERPNTIFCVPSRNLNVSITG